MSEWQPIETAPRDGTTVLVLFNGNVPTPLVARYIDDGPWPWATPRDRHGSLGKKWVTHWMPIPEPPK